jgi:hypothetical protein
MPDRNSFFISNLDYQDAEAPHPLALLRACRERPCHCAAKQRYELAPPHSITLSTNVSFSVSLLI